MGMVNCRRRRRYPRHLRQAFEANSRVRLLRMLDRMNKTLSRFPDTLIVNRHRIPVRLNSLEIVAKNT